MKNSNYKLGIFSSSTLKLIGCVLMAIDHIGYHLFRDLLILQIIGRIAFPIFAFFIAEGCYYTKNKIKHFLLIFISGFVFLIVTKIFNNTWFGNIFLQFSISILYIYLLDFLKKFSLNKEHKIFKSIISIIIFSTTVALGYFLFTPNTILTIPLHFDYDFWTTMLPVGISLVYLKDYSNKKIVKYLDNHYTKLLIMSLILIFICSNPLYHKAQWFAFLALPLLLLCNGKIGCKKLKYFFYLFYPLHIVIIILIKFLFF